MTNLAPAGTPILFSAVYDGVGNVAGTEMLYGDCCGLLLAVLAYASDGHAAKAQTASQEGEELETIDKYEEMDDLTYSHLPLEVVGKVGLKMMEAGKPPRMVFWGEYAKERPTLTDMPQRAAKDFQYIVNDITEKLQDRDKMIQEQKDFKQYKDMIPVPDREKAKQEMGAWIADYFDDGYAQLGGTVAGLQDDVDDRIPSHRPAR